MNGPIRPTCALALVAGAFLFPMGTRASHAAARLLPRPDVERFALVVGSNETLDHAQSPLRFADDDAARMTELLRGLGTHVELLTTFDRDSQQVFPSLVTTATRPTRKNLLAAHRRLAKRMAAAKQTGKEVELVLYYSGHGDVGPDGQGYLTLDGGKLTRNDLFMRLLAKSPADHNHLLVDACRSEEFVLSRGKGWKPDRAGPQYGRAVQTYLEKNHLGAFPNTGVLLAHSVDQQTHEWERYQGGIFTHELLSGLRGGADLNGDGRIEYSELAAFASAANSGVQDPRARLQVVARPPRDDQRHPLVTHEDVAKQRVLLLTGPMSHRFSIEDARGVRLADVHRSGPQPAYVRLPPGEVFVYREPVGGVPKLEESRIGAADTGVIVARRLEFAPAQRAPRGALDQALRQGLFSVGYGPGYYAGFVDTHGMLAVHDPTWEVTVWEQVDGERVEVANVAATDEDETDLSPEEGDDTTETKTVVVVEESDDWPPREIWGAVSAGTIFTPFRTEADVRLPRKRVIANQAAGWAGPLRGIDLRWHTFWLRDQKARRFNFPRTQWYFRTGYTQGRINFLPEDSTMGFSDGQPTSLEYLTVPLFVGGNIYALERFPVRPFVGMGAGFDILRVQYERVNGPVKVDVSARIGFELHGGLEIRVTNYVALTGEVMQLWSARRKLGKSVLPDFSNEGFTLMTGVAVGFPLHKRNQKKRVKTTRKVITVEDNDAPRKVKGTPTPGDPDAVKIEVKVGDQTTVVEGKKKASDDGDNADDPGDGGPDEDDPPVKPTAPPSRPEDTRAADETGGGVTPD